MSSCCGSFPSVSTPARKSIPSISAATRAFNLATPPRALPSPLASSTIAPATTASSSSSPPASPRKSPRTTSRPSSPPSSPSPSSSVRGVAPYGDEMTSQLKFGTPSNVFWIVMTLVAVLVWAFWFQTWAWHEARQMEKSDPCLAIVPRPLPDASASQAAAIKQAYFGYEFEVPFPGPETARAYSSTSFGTATLVFHSDYGLV